jgi:ABC-type multidrug transport system fused ATPase/permease subunit
MDKGEVIADGSHEEVYGKCELYRNLYDRQQDSGA